jgi:hypothetical protein
LKIKLVLVYRNLTSKGWGFLFSIIFQLEVAWLSSSPQKIYRYKINIREKILSQVLKLYLYINLITGKIRGGGDFP